MKKIAKSKRAEEKNEFYESEPSEEIGETRRECSICGELVNPACLLFIGTDDKGQALFACGDCCCSSCEDSRDVED